MDITNLKAEGGQQQLNELMRTRDELKASTIAQIEKIRTALREEEADDNTMKKQYGSSWTRLTSSELNQAMISELGKYSDFLQQAVSADAVVTENVEAHRQVLQVLQFRQISELEAMLPSVIVDQNSGTNNNNFGISSTLSSQVAQLRTHLQGLEKNKNEKTYLNDEIEKMAATDESPASLTSISAPSEEDIKAAVAKTMQKVIFSFFFLFFFCGLMDSFFFFFFSRLRVVSERSLQSLKCFKSAATTTLAFLMTYFKVYSFSPFSFFFLFFF